MPQWHSVTRVAEVSEVAFARFAPARLPSMDDASAGNAASSKRLRSPAGAAEVISSASVAHASATSRVSISDSSVCGTDATQPAASGSGRWGSAAANLSSTSRVSASPGNAFPPASPSPSVRVDVASGRGAPLASFDSWRLGCVKRFPGGLGAGSDVSAMLKKRPTAALRSPRASRSARSASAASAPVIARNSRTSESWMTEVGEAGAPPPRPPPRWPLGGISGDARTRLGTPNGCLRVSSLFSAFRSRRGSSIKNAHA